MMDASVSMSWYSPSAKQVSAGPMGIVIRRVQLQRLFQPSDSPLDGLRHDGAQQVGLGRSRQQLFAMLKVNLSLVLHVRIAGVDSR